LETTKLRFIGWPLNASLTAAMVVRSLWAALGVVWVTGVLLGWVVDRLVVCWPVS
jgi:hypothetical protein